MHVLFWSNNSTVYRVSQNYEVAILTVCSPRHNNSREKFKAKLPENYEPIRWYSLVKWLMVIIEPIKFRFDVWKVLDSIDVIDSLGRWGDWSSLDFNFAF